MPAEFGLQRTVTASRPSTAFYSAGPIVQAEITRAEHPISFGYDERTVAVHHATGRCSRCPKWTRPTRC